jgi:hypothetical protein
MKKLALVALLFAASVSEAPAQTFVTLQNGAMVPCDHPLAQAEGKTCHVPPPAPEPTPAIAPPLGPFPPLVAPPPYTPDAPTFRLGKSYFRTADGQRIFVAALGQTSQGTQMYYMECLNTMFPDRCAVDGAIWAMVGNVSANGWIEEQ